MNKMLLAAVMTTSLVMAGCGGSSSSPDTGSGGGDGGTGGGGGGGGSTTVTISGTVTDSNSVALAGVSGQAIYVAGSPSPVSGTTDASGNYSITVEKNKDLYLSVTNSGYITVNSEIMNLSANITGVDTSLVTVTDAEAMLQGVFSDSTLTMSSAAWLVVDVVDANGNRITDGTGGSSVTVTPGPDAVVTDADPTTVPSYFGKYAAGGNVTVTVGGVSKTGVLKTGEVLFMTFQQ